MSMAMGKSGPEINVTPLIDVMLVMIIIFLVIQSSMKSTGEEALVPQPPDQAAHPQPPDVGPIVIRLLPARAAGGDGERPALMINGESVTWAGLHDRLQEIYLKRMEKVAFVQAEKDVDFEYVAEVIDTAHSVEIDKVGLLGPEARPQ